MESLPFFFFSFPFLLRLDVPVVFALVVNDDLSVAILQLRNSSSFLIRPIKMGYKETP